MKINYLTKNIILGFAAIIIITVLIFTLAPLAKYSIYLYILVLISLGLIYGYFKKRTNNFASGLIGENDVSDELKHLPSDFICIDDGLDTGRGNIDKIVIGPTGVWTLEVKSHKGNIIPTDDFLKQPYAEAKTLQDLIKFKLNLDINVQPVLVFSNKYAKVRFGLNKQNGVYVIQKAWLKKLLIETHVQNLDNQTVLKISSIISPDDSKI